MKFKKPKGRTHEVKKKEKMAEFKSAVEETTTEQFLERQEKFYSFATARQYTGAKLKVFQEQLEKIEKEGKCDMLWNGMPYPKVLLALDHDIELNEYKKLLVKEDNASKILKEHYKLSDAELQEILNGKMFNAVKEGVKMESKPKTGYIG